MNSGSSAMLKMPPSVMPTLDCSECPSARIRCASSVFIAVPIVILYFCLVKHIVNGLTAGAVKG